MRYAIVLGTGGHCRVVLSIIEELDFYDVLSIVEIGTFRPGELIMGRSVEASPDYLFTLSGRSDIDVFLAIGDNYIRRLWWDRVKSLALPMPNLISPNALVSNSASLGESNVICARAFVGPEAKIGNNNLINTSAVVEHEVYIGHDCHLAPSSTVAGRSHLDDLCFVGAGATVIDGMSIASRTVIGAGATLVRDVDQPGGVYVGTPAKRRGLLQ